MVKTFNFVSTDRISFGDIDEVAMSLWHSCFVWVTCGNTSIAFYLDKDNETIYVSDGKLGLTHKEIKVDGQVFHLVKDDFLAFFDMEWEH